MQKKLRKKDWKNPRNKLVTLMPHKETVDKMNRSKRRHKRIISYGVNAAKVMYLFMSVYIYKAF